MLLLVLATGFLVSVGATAVLIPPLRKIALRSGWVDRPDGERKLHPEPVPTVGGIAIALGFLIGVAYVYSIKILIPFELPAPPLAMWIAGLTMVLVGFVDDSRGLGFKQKLFAQAVIALYLIQAGYRIDLSGLSFLGVDPYVETLYSSLLTLLWIVGIINAVNLLDGLDGLAAGVSMIGFACLAVIFSVDNQFGLIVPALLIAGALVGFLFYNFNPASIFMGDSGSLLLGVFLAAYSLESQAHADPVLALMLPVVALGLPVLDTNLSILRRLINRQAVFAPDRDHIHHRLLLRYSPRQAVLILYGVATFFGVVAILMKLATAQVAYLLLGGVAVLSCAGVYAMGYIRARPLLFSLHPKLGDLYSDYFGSVENRRSFLGGDAPADSHEPDPSSSRVVGNRQGHPTLATGDRVASRGDGAHTNLVPYIADSEPSGMIKESSIVVAADGLTYANLGEESVILNLETGIYFGLNDVGAHILEKIKEPTEVREVIDSLLSEFDVDRQRVRSDTLNFLTSLQDAKLINIMNGTAA